MSAFNLADTFVALGQRHLNRPALVGGGRQLSFDELARSAARTARALAVTGIAPGQNVGLALRDGIDTTVHLIALWMIDAVGVIIDFRSPAAERLALVDEFDLVAVLVDSGPTLEKAIIVDDHWRELVARQSPTPPTSSRNAGDIAVIALTSGTTGRPLGLLVRHEDTLRHIAHPLHRNIGASGTHLVAMPLHFSAARTNIIARLVQGWTVAIYPPLFAAEELAEEIRRVAPDTAHFVPTVIRGMLDYARTRAAPLFPSFRQLMAGGSMTSPEEKREALRLLSPNYVEVYGSTLCSGMSYLSGDDILTHPDTVGRVTESVRLEIVDEVDAALPNGQEGIIRVRGPFMTTETYKNRTRPFGDRIKDGWVYPGDLGSRDDEGFLRIVGRASEVLIRGGANVHPSEIERVLAADPRVRGVAVVGFSAAREGEEIAAFVVGDGTLTEADLQALARSGLAPDKRPRRFEIVDRLPLTSVGKLDRKALRARLEGG